MGRGAEDMKYRFQWTFPIVVSPHDPNMLYAAAQRALQEHQRGAELDAISPDLTRQRPAKMGPSGGPITKDQTSVEYYATIFTFAESPVRRRRCSGPAPTTGSCTSRGTAAPTGERHAPGHRRRSRASRSSMPRRTTPGTAYVAANRYQLDDFAPYIWNTTDYGDDLDARSRRASRRASSCA